MGNEIKELLERLHKRKDKLDNLIEELEEMKAKAEGQQHLLKTVR